MTTVDGVVDLAAAIVDFDGVAEDLAASVVVDLDERAAGWSDRAIVEFPCNAV